MQPVEIPGAELEVSDSGTGEPIILVQTALTADELEPVGSDAALDGYRTVLYHRRGYAGSSPVAGPGSIAREAADCRALMDARGIERAHIVGLSLSGAIALQLASEIPERVHSLVLVEPPPVHTPSNHEFRAAHDRLIRRRRETDLVTALDEFLALVIGADWRRMVETRLAGATAQIERDAGTFFDSDLPALLEWRFAPGQVRRISCPVLYVGGTDRGAWFQEVRELIHRWLPHVEDAVIEGADHSLALTHSAEIAHALRGFLRSHPI